uniref:Peptidase S8/S53 domain-containing protein n=1 Tax=Solanum lycopersicum TaxID=4081 RepID=A0A3Q7EY82_SOLLC
MGRNCISKTGTDDMYMLVSAIHSLNDTAAKDMYVSECQDASKFNHTLVQGNLLICSYSIRFVLGLSTIKQASETAMNLSAAGVVFAMDPFVISYQLNPVPMRLPGIIIPSPDDSKILLQYYNSSLEKDETTRKIVKFGAVACILGGVTPNFSLSAPKVMYYSARGPDPEDNSVDNADILKPNLVAPGNSIWAAWSSRGAESIEFQGENFAMMSGTSMAAPHIAGLAALIKQKFPTFSPAAIGSALSTTASQHNKYGGPILAQRAYANPDLNQSPATSFDMGSGFVNATAALDPGLILDTNDMKSTSGYCFSLGSGMFLWCSKKQDIVAQSTAVAEFVAATTTVNQHRGYNDYMAFLCGINGSAPVLLNYTGESCGVSTMNGADLNMPSITISKLNQSRKVQRMLTNIAGNETYIVGWSAPNGVSVKVNPKRFFVASAQQQILNVFLNATMNSTTPSFGRIGLVGNKGHVVNIPLSVVVKISYHSTNS